MFRIDIFCWCTPDANTSLSFPRFMPTLRILLTLLLSTWTLLARYGHRIVVYAYADRGDNAGYEELRARGANREIIQTSEGDKIDVYWFK